MIMMNTKTMMDDENDDDDDDDLGIVRQNPNLHVDPEVKQVNRLMVDGATCVHAH